MIIRRAAEVLNPDGDPIPAAWHDHITLDGKFAPANPSEPFEIGRTAVISDGVIFIRDLLSRPDILDTDHAVVRGVEFEIDGEVGAWLRKETWAVQFAIKRVKG
ncbi:hypothetical protein NS234_04830 [Microbacterium oxydans]|nr:hypothetical protein NS234_04830 [Microbacterium oxydans]